MSDDEAPRAPWLAAAVDTLLSLLAGLLVLLAALTVVGVLPFVLLITAFQGDMSAAAPPNWHFYLWTAFAFAACIFTVITGLGVMSEPRARSVAGLTLLALVVFLSFPHFWWPS